MRHIIHYSLPYRHHVEFGVEAPNPEAAKEVAAEAMDTGELFFDSDRYHILRDEYVEEGDSGEVLEFDVLQTLKGRRNWPKAHVTVQAQDRADLAMAACRQLVAAYRTAVRNGSGGSIDWSDVDDAHELARKALRPVKA